jgi:H+/gluconate symporter-like permease
MNMETKFQSNAYEPEDVILISTIFSIWEMFGLGMATLAALILGTMIGYKIHKHKKAKREDDLSKTKQEDNKKEQTKSTPKSTNQSNSQPKSSQSIKKK